MLEGESPLLPSSVTKPEVSSILLLAKVLFKMARPTQLLAIILVYIYGSLVALANGVAFDLITFLIGLTVVLPISASIHYANEYADFETDSLTTRTPFSGGSGVLPESGLPPVLALRAAWIALIVGGFAAFLSRFFGVLNSPALVLLFLGAFLGWMYSLRPLALAWRGWGELDNAFLGGVLLPFYAYVVQVGELNSRALLIFIPFGMLVFINLLATTWADREADAAVGKYTLATRWSVTGLRLLYLVVTMGVFAYLVFFRGFLFPGLVFWVSLLIAPVLVWGIFTYTRQHSPFPTVTAMTAFLILQIVGWGMTILSA
jgi:1,4-dihydroxy-2-naphthoate octaprenyltransferase